MDSDDNANDYDEKIEDWYHSSDTSDDIPDPNMSADPLFQDQDLLPEPLQRDHFKEGLIYTMTKHIDRKNALLVLIIEAKLRTFSYQCFFQQRSSSSTYHKTGKETKCAYKDIWRLAPRRELVEKCDPNDATTGQMLRFEYGMSSTPTTITVIRRRSREIEGQVICGADRGKEVLYSTVEMLHCTEVFGSSMLYDLLSQVKDAKQANADKSKTRKGDQIKPKMNHEYHCPNEEKYKRVWHVFKILGNGVKMMIEKTNKRAKRRLSRSNSDAYKKRWVDMTEGGFRTFLGVWLGVAMLGVGARHMTKANLKWLNQTKENELFGKLPLNLWRLQSANFVAHDHRDTILFKKSIKEQRLRFYGAEELAKEVYRNSRNARQVPISISADETITRLYSQKARQIRMRTAKKNESGIKNQSICGANDEYEGQKPGDPVGSGYTFISSSYPGASLNRGSMFREKDMGDVLQMIFTCRDYFRGAGVELVTDSHFGHFVPVVFLKTWNIYVTSSFQQKQRIGISNIKELSKKEYDDSEKEKVLHELKEQVENLEEDVKDFDPFDETSSSSEEEKIKPYGKPEKKNEQDQ